MTRSAAVLTALLLLAGCAGIIRPPGRLSPLPTAGSDTPGFSEIDGALRPDPFSSLDLWPNRVESRVYPVTVRYQDDGDESDAIRVTRYLEQAWRANEEAGLRAPFAYAPDGSNRFTAFLWRDLEACLALSGARASGASWEAHESFLVLDIWSGCGGEHMDAVVAHELHQAVTLAYDPWEDPVFRVASATWFQDLAFDEDNLYFDMLADFQARPEWAITHDDGFQSYYAYGASLFLMFLSERYYDDGARFLSAIWEASRGTRGSGSIYQPLASTTDNPTWAHGLELTLPQGVSLADALTEFARWRWFVGERSRDSFSESALFPSDAEIDLRGVDLSEGPHIQSHVEVTGSRYFVLERDGRDEVSLAFEGDDAVDWVLHTGDGQQITSDTLDFAGQPTMLLIVTAVPRGILDTTEPFESVRFRMTLAR